MTTASALIIARIERLSDDETRLRLDGGVWSQGVHVGDVLRVTDRDGYTTFADVERGDDERPVLRCRARVSSLRTLQIRRVALAPVEHASV